MILVTGASGLVGQHLLESLTRSGKQVRAISRHKPTAYFTQIVPELLEWVSGDILDTPFLETAFRGITEVYHCAGMVTYDARYREAMMECNVTGTANIVNFCLDAGVRKLVHVSSIATLGDATPGGLIDENSDWEEGKLNSMYAVSKQAAEMEVYRGIAEGLQAVIVNPGIILGEGDANRSSSNLFRLVYDEFPYYTNGITAWVDVKDVIDAMVYLMDHEVSNERYILSCGNFSYRDILTSIAIAMGKKAPTKAAGKGLTALVWRLAYLRSVLNGKVATLTRETARSAHAIRNFDNRKLLRAIPGFQYRDLTQSIARIAPHYSQL